MKTPSRFAVVSATIIKWLIIVFPLGFMAWFMSSYFFLSGVGTFVNDFCSSSREISRLGPWDRLTPKDADDRCVVTMIQSPVSFDVKAPRWFQSAKFSITFDPKKENVLLFGVRRRDLITIDITPIYSRLLQDDRWKIVMDNGIALYQKTNEFQSVGSFLSDIEKNKNRKIATLDYPLPIRKKIEGYEPTEGMIKISKTLRGPHAFSVYVKNEPLVVTIEKQDLNNVEGKDPLLIEASEFGKPLKTVVLADDGIDIGGGKERGAMQSETFTLPGLEQGAYRIELKTTDDVLIRSIASSSEKIVFHDHIFLADNKEYLPDIDESNQETRLTTVGKDLAFWTSHPNGFQTINFNGAEQIIDRANKVYEMNDIPNPAQIVIPKNDVIVEMNGLFAFERNQFFDPLPDALFPLEQKSDTDYDDVEFAIARYSPAVTQRTGLINTASFDLNPFLSDDFQTRAFFIVPAFVEQSAGIDIQRIEAQFRKPPITIKNIRERLTNAIKRQ